MPSENWLGAACPRREPPKREREPKSPSPSVQCQYHIPEGATCAARELPAHSGVPIDVSLSSDDVPIVRPCPVELSADFRGGARTRHCGHCDKTVHLLSSLTAREADALLAEHADGDLCVTYLVDENGGIQFRPEPTVVPVTSLVRRRRPAIAAAGFAAALAACAPHDNPQVRDRAVDDPIETHDRRPTIPDEPCESGKPTAEDPGLVLAAGGIMAMPKVEPTPPRLSAGRPAIRPMRAGGARAR